MINRMYEFYKNPTRNVLVSDISIGMLNMSYHFEDIRMEHIDPKDVPADCVSMICDQNTANIVGNIIGRELALNNTEYRIEHGDVIFIAHVKDSNNVDFYRMTQIEATSDMEIHYFNIPF